MELGHLSLLSGSVREGSSCLFRAKYTRYEVCEYSILALLIPLYTRYEVWV